MRNLFIISTILFSFIPENKGQHNEPFRDKPPSAIYISYQPTDHGLGIRGDYHINYWAGVYSSASYGQWRLYKWSGLDQHVKLTAGALIPYKDWMGNQHDFSLGLNYHWVSGEIAESEIYKNDKAFDRPWSFELGLTIKYPRFALAVRTDILRWEPCVDIGIPLNFKDKPYKVKMPKRKQPTFYF